ncbi:MAG: hypothetical protein WCS77_07420 [Elusimicrobiaceae bacterium]
MKHHTVFLLLFLLCPALAGAGELTRGPYVDSVGSDAAQIRFNTSISTVAWVTYGPVPNCDMMMTLATGDDEHKIPVFRLLPDKVFCYAIYLLTPDGVNTYKAAQGRFKTLADPITNKTEFLVFGNTASDSDEKAQLAEQMSAQDAAFAIHTGNITETGLESDMDGMFFKPYEKLLLKMPFFFALGQNEYGKKRATVAGKNILENNFMKLFSLSDDSGAPRYYYISTANARFIFLDANTLSGAKFAPGISDTSPQITWLKSTLLKAREPWKFVVINRPVYSTGPGGGAESAELRKVLSPIFDKYRVQAVFQGYDGDYERTAQIRLNRKVSTNGTRYFTFGGGGMPLTDPDSSADWSEKFISDYTYGRVVLNGRQFKLTVYDKNGEVVDETEFKR